MAGGDSPTISRRRVRLALREAREARGLTQSEVAEAMEWSLSKVIRIEDGDVSISPNDLRPLLSFLGFRDRPTIDSLVADAKIARTRPMRSWWQDEHFHDYLTPGMPRLLEFEQEAVAIRYFSMFAVPGPMPTRRFAEAVASPWSDHLTPDDIEARVEARLPLGNTRGTGRLAQRRRQALLGRLDPPKLSVLLDESLVFRPYGGKAVLIDQLTDLRRLADEGRVSLRMVPFTVESSPPTWGTFDLPYLVEDGDDENAVIYRESGNTDEIVEDRVRAEQYHVRFDELWNVALTEGETLDLLSKGLSESSS